MVKLRKVFGTAAVGLTVSLLGIGTAHADDATYMYYLFMYDNAGYVDLAHPGLDPMRDDAAYINAPWMRYGHYVCNKETAGESDDEIRIDLIDAMLEQQYTHGTTSDIDSASKSAGLVIKLAKKYLC
ncbi:hypothetical protein [Nocardia sp. NPDC059239]|uniref:hypothetical protein n=1 Tax=Nocardia sp. NPDC059239 TaxID=3346785 RepID=UPI0036A5B5B9